MSTTTTIRAQSPQPSYFVMVPAMAMGLDPYPLKLLLVYMETCRTADGVCFKSNATLEEEAGMGRKTIEKHRKTLAEMGYIHYTPGTGGDASNTATVVVLYDEIWKKNELWAREREENRSRKNVHLLPEPCVNDTPPASFTHTPCVNDDHTPRHEMPTEVYNYKYMTISTSADADTDDAPMVPSDSVIEETSGEEEPNDTVDGASDGNKTTGKKRDRVFEGLLYIISNGQLVYQRMTTEEKKQHGKTYGGRIGKLRKVLDKWEQPPDADELKEFVRWWRREKGVDLPAGTETLPIQLTNYRNEMKQKTQVRQQVQQQEQVNETLYAMLVAS